MNKRTGTKVSSKAKVCTRCGSKKNLQTHKKVCRKCDTSYMGTWYLSCISELDYIEIADDIRDGYTFGRTGNDFLGLPNKTPIYCYVDEHDKNLFHVSYDMNNMDEEEWMKDYDVWWDHPSVTKVDFRVNFGIEVTKK